MLRADSFYKENIINRSEELSFVPSLKLEGTIQSTDEYELLPNLSNIRLREHKRGVYYISDIHLEHKIYKRFGKRGTLSKVTKYIEEIVDSLLSDDDGCRISFSIPATILIIGDTAHSFALNKLFYETLSKKCSYYNDIFVVLGNHELWEFDSVDLAISAYDKLFENLPNIHLLQNSLYISNPHLDWQKRVGKTDEERHKDWMKKSIISENDLLRMTPKELRDICMDSKEIVFGAIGFSPLNKSFNVLNGIYRDTIKTVDQEKELAKKTADIYEKLIDALPNNYLIIASHMPLTDWTDLPYQNGWTYFNGHTHRNERVLDERGHVYADNQIGYNGKRIKFNSITVEHRYDYFAYYKDGIYDITETDYHNYYYGLSKRMVSVDKRGGQNFRIKMLKNEGIYLFLIENENGKMYLLEGGKRRVLNNQDITYYYNNIALMNKAIAEAIKASGVKDYLERLSLFIRSIGGSGYVHGNIVDIDFFDHIMVDIRTGEIMPYFAYSIADRYEYPNLPKLLQDNRPDLYKRFIAKGGNALPILRKNNEISESIRHDIDTSIYKDSNIMLKIQDMLDYNVIRFWNDELIESITKVDKRNIQTDQKHLLSDKFN